MRRRTTERAALVLVLALGATAFAHGGQYTPPPDPAPPAGEVPPNDHPPPDPPPPKDANGPSTGGGDSGGPATPAGGPSTGGGGGGSPATGGGKSGGPSTGGGGGGAPSTGGRGKAHGRVPDDHWTHWWYANRLFLLDMRGRVRDHAVSTPGAADAKPEMWRAQVQEALTLVLSDPDEDVSSGAAVALGKGGDAADSPPLVALLLDVRRQQAVREAAALGLGLLPPEKGSAASDAARHALESVAVDEGAPMRLRGFAVYALGMRADPVCMPFLLDAAQSAGGGRWDVPAAGLSGLGLSRSPLTRDDLESFVAEPKAERQRLRMRRIYAAHGLARLGDAHAAAALRAAARDEDEDVRRAALLALAALTAPEDAATADVFVRALHQDRDRACRGIAAVALGRTGPERAERELRWAYANGDAIERPFAALALGLLARKGGRREVAATLRSELENCSGADLRGALCVAVGLAGDAESAPLVRRIASERGGDPETRAHAALALGMLGDADGAPTLRALLKDSPAPGVQREAALALGMLGDREAVSILLGLVTDGSSVYVQGSAAIALGRIGGEDASKALLDLLRDRSRPGIARGMAAVSLGLLLDRTEGRALASVGADLDWYAATSTVREILDIL